MSKKHLSKYKQSVNGLSNNSLFIILLGVVKLICALLSTNIYEINVQFRNLKTIDILLVRIDSYFCSNNIESNKQNLLKTRSVCYIWSFFQDLFFKYSLNNFLHAQVEQCITFLFTWSPQPQIPDISATGSNETVPVGEKDIETLQWPTVPDTMPVDDEGKYCYVI